MSKKPPQPQLLVFARVVIHLADGTSVEFAQATAEPQTQGNSIAFVVTLRSGPDAGRMYVFPLAPATSIRYFELEPSRLVAN